MDILDLKNKLLEKAIMEWIESIEDANPEEICIKMEEIRERLSGVA